MRTIYSIKAELLKLKYPPILWLISFVLITMFAILFAAYFIDIHRTTNLGVNPWIKFVTASQGIFASFFAVPFLVLLVSASVYLEYESHGFKQLYALPVQRGMLLVYRVLALVVLIGFTFLILLFVELMVAVVISFMYPELEFYYFSTPYLKLLKSLKSTGVALLGVFGVQLFLSLRFKSFLVPASFGVLAFIVGLVIGTINTPMALYFPYSYSIISQDYGMFSFSEIPIVDYGFIDSIELNSIFVFVVFLLLSIWMEYRRNV